MIELLRGDRAFVKVGHRGAPALAPENTLRSFEAAIGHGVDLVELDVLDLADGTLVLAHSDDLLEVSHGAARGRVRVLSLTALREVAPELPTLDEALEFLAPRPVGVQVDVKAAGHERPIAEALRRHALLERSFASTSSLPALAALAVAEPRLPRSLSYPDDRRGLAERRLVRPAIRPGLAAMRRSLPARLPRWLRRAGASAATLNHTVVSAAAVRRCHALGIAVYAWTVDDPDVARSLVRMGTDGIITNDPRIFSGPLTT